MNNSSQVVEANLQALANNLLLLKSEAGDLYKYYFSTAASSQINGLATSTTPATTASGGGLNKNQFLNGITMITSFVNFFSNQAVSQLDYLSSAQNLIGGSFPASSALSADVEAIGSRLKGLGQNVIQYYKDASKIMDIWNSMELTNVNGALSSSTVMPGCNTTKSKFDAGIGLVQQYLNMVGGQVVTAGYWGNIASIWSLGS